MGNKNVYFLFLLLFLDIEVSNGMLLAKPNDTLVTEGEDASFTCISDWRDVSVEWAFSNEGEEERKIVINYIGLIMRAYRGRVTAERNITGFHRLTIHNVTFEDAGRYVCRDEAGDEMSRRAGHFAYAELVVLERSKPTYTIYGTKDSPLEPIHKRCVPAQFPIDRIYFSSTYAGNILIEFVEILNFSIATNIQSAEDKKRDDGRVMTSHYVKYYSKQDKFIPFQVCLALKTQRNYNSSLTTHDFSFCTKIAECQRKKEYAQISKGKLLAAPSDTLVTEGEDASFTCISDWRDVSVEWAFSNPGEKEKIVVNYAGLIMRAYRGGKVTAERNITGFNRLTIHNVTFEDAGRYVCKAQAGDEMSRRTGHYAYAELVVSVRQKLDGDLFPLLLRQSGTHYRRESGYCRDVDQFKKLLKTHLFPT